MAGTFCDNAWALQCAIAGISIDLMGESVDSAFWTIGGWGRRAIPLYNTDKQRDQPHAWVLRLFRSLYRRQTHEIHRTIGLPARLDSARSNGRMGREEESPTGSLQKDSPSGPYIMPPAKR